MEEYSAEDLVVHHLAPEGDHRMPLIRPLDKAITLFPSLLESQKWQLSQGGCFCGCGGWGSWDITSCFFPFLRNSPQGVVRWDCFTFDQVGAVHCLFFQPGVTLIYVFHDYVSDAEHLSGAESTNYWCLTAAEKILSLFPFFFWPGFFVGDQQINGCWTHFSTITMFMSACAACETCRWMRPSFSTLLCLLPRNDGDITTKPSPYFCLHDQSIVSLSFITWFTILIQVL